MAEGTSDILRSKLESVLNESRAKQAKDLNEMDVLGERVPIKSEKARICLIRAHQTLYEIEQAAAESTDTVMAQYDQLFVAFNDALEIVRADLRSLTNDKAAASGIARAHLQKLQTGLLWQKHNHTVRRTQLLVESFKQACSEGSGAAGTARKVRLWRAAFIRLPNTPCPTSPTLRVLGFRLHLRISFGSTTRSPPHSVRCHSSKGTRRTKPSWARSWRD